MQAIFRLCSKQLNRLGNSSPKAVSVCALQNIVTINSQIDEPTKRCYGVFTSPSNVSLSQKTELLKPISPMMTQSCGMKVKGFVKRRCKSCYFVMRDSRLYVECKAKPRHKQMQVKESPHNTWILTHATQSKIRPW